MTKLPPPPSFVSESVVPTTTEEPVAAQSISPPCDAVAGSPPDEHHRFVLDVEQFMADIEEVPAFIRAPRHEYLLAVTRGAA